MSAVSFCGAIVAATLSGLVASGGYTSNCNSFHYASSCKFSSSPLFYHCFTNNLSNISTFAAGQPWLDIEWALMSFSIIAALNHLTLTYYANIAYKNRHNKVRSTIVSVVPVSCFAPLYFLKSLKFLDNRIMPNIQSHLAPTSSTAKMIGLVMKEQQLRLPYTLVLTKHPKSYRSKLTFIISYYKFM